MILPLGNYVCLLEFEKACYIEMFWPPESLKVKLS